MTSPHTPRRPSAADDDDIEVVRHEERLAVRTEPMRRSGSGSSGSS